MTDSIKIIHDRRKPRGPSYDVVSAAYVGGYRLLITFDNGVSRTVDFRRYLWFSHHRHLKNYRRIENFLEFHIEYGKLMWGDFDMLFHTESLYHGEIDRYKRPSKRELGLDRRLEK